MLVEFVSPGPQWELLPWHFKGGDLEICTFNLCPRESFIFAGQMLGGGLSVHGMWKFLDQELNLPHNSDQSCSGNHMTSLRAEATWGPSGKEKGSVSIWTPFPGICADIMTHT